MPCGGALAAVVVDDGTEHAGTKAVERWLHEHIIGPRIVLSPVSLADGPVLTADADGDFPGGPLRFDFRFTIDAGRIGALTISLPR